MSFIEVGQLIEKEPKLQLKVVAGRTGLKRHLISIDVNRPGLALAGFYKEFANDRIQIIGKGEYAYITDQPAHAERVKEEFFQYNIPAVVFTHGNKPPESIIQAAEETSTPVLCTPLTTHNFILYFSQTITLELAPTTSLHGVFVEIFGVGILLTGQSGIGKSETALELVERGHRLVADDIVIIKCVGNTSLYGTASEVIRHHMELRGLGIINVKDLFGVGAIREYKRIELVIGLEDWDQNKEYDRLGLDEEFVEILGVQLPRILLPVRPGRNVPILIETAAMNQRSKLMGYHAARELSKRISNEISQKGL